MNHERVSDHRFYNLMHSLLLLGGMVMLLALIGQIFFGTPGVTLAIVAGAAVFTLGRVRPQWVLKMHRAQPVSYAQAPALYQLVHGLAQRAELRRGPDLYLVPSPTLNAFAVGNADESAIGVTHGLLQTLDRQELAGVLAHEISHIRHRDLWVMGLAQLIGRMTRSLSWLGQLILVLSLPALFMGGFQVPLSAVLLLIAAPTLSSLLLLALSRTRELEADLGAARLTGDPLGLASALAKLEARQGGWWRFLFPMPRRTSSFLDSHPATVERIERLRSLVDRPSGHRDAEPRDPAHRSPVKPRRVRSPHRVIEPHRVRQRSRSVPVRLIDRGPVAWPTQVRRRHIVPRHIAPRNTVRSHPFFLTA